MAMVKPLAQAVAAFSADQPHKFTFISNGGNQVKYNRITIRNNATNIVVYQNKIETDELFQIVPANTLVNGTYYNYYFNTYDASGNESPDSNIITFYTYSTPTIRFTNIPLGNVIDQSFYTFDFIYNQAQGELLGGMFLSLYDTSGNLLKQSEELVSQYTPPISMSYTFSGFSDGATYRIQAVAKSINGTTTTSTVTFEVKYERDELFLFVDLENMCDEGYVKVTNNIRLIDGESYPSPPVYIDNKTKVELDYNEWVRWNHGYEFSADRFLIREKWRPMLFGEYIQLKNIDKEASPIEIVVNFKRGIPVGEFAPKDYFEVRGYQYGKEYFYQRSNYLDLLNATSNVHTWIKKSNGNFDLEFTDFGTADTLFEWNGASNVEYNRITDIFWADEPKADTVIDVPYYTTPTLPYIDVITSTYLRNSIVDYFDISRDIGMAFNTDLPVWDRNTILNCDFDNNINGSNVGFTLSQIDSLRFKRRKLGTLDWYTFKEVIVRTEADLFKSANDFHLPSGVLFEWAIVPAKGGRELSYFTNMLTTQFNGIFITDTDDNVVKLFSGVTYASNTSNNAIGQLQPIGSDVPVIIENGKVDYQTLSVTGDIFDKTFYDTRIIDRELLVEQQEKYQNILKNGKYKSLKDWNGRILIGLVTSPLTYTYNSSYGMGIPNVGFTFTEQGKYDDQTRMLSFGLSEVD